MARWRVLWANVRDSLWFTPSVITLFCAVLAILLVHLERNAIIDIDSDIGWIFGGSGSGAREMLGTIAGSLITVTGVVFSVMVIALQLASSQYTPRVLRGFISDRLDQAVLGILIGTFTYSLIVMRSIRAEGEDLERFVPELAVLTGLVLLLVSVAALITFINHATRSIQIEEVVERQVGQARAQIAKLFPAALGEADHARQTPTDYPAMPSAEVTTPRGGFLQTVEADSIFDLAVSREATVAIEWHIGDFVLPNEVVARVWPAELLDDDLRDQILSSLVFGHERTHEQDPQFGILGVADIAKRALSPSLNDPTTAMLCIDRLGELLVHLGGRALPARTRTDDSGRIRVIVRRSHFDRALELSFGNVRQHGMGIPTVVLKLLDTLRRLGPLLPPMYRPALAHEALAILHAARSEIDTPTDRQRIEELGAQTLAWLGSSAHARVDPDPPADPSSSPATTRFVAGA